MGSPWKVRFLQDVIRQDRPSVIFLCETLSSKVQMERVRLKIKFQGMLMVEAQGRSGGLALFWKENDQVKLLSLSQNHIDVEITIRGMLTWRLTGFYGEPNQNQRRRTWDLLRHLARDSNLPWVTMGDMNNIVSQLDKRGGTAYPQKLIDGFNAVLEETGLQDMELYGHQFTWERGRNTENWLEIRLDRALVTNGWYGLFPLAKLYRVEGSPSDHSPIFLEPKANLVQQAHSEEVISCVSQKLTPDQNLELMKEVMEVEVKMAIFQMHPDKAPGPDGMTPAFFQKHLKILGEDVVKMTRKFFRTGVMLRGLNEMNIVLIPKKKNPTMVGDLRPIVLCNMLAKINTKVLANRMKGLLDVVVSDTQSAFIPGRLISDKVMISYEVMHYLNRKRFGKEGFMALKLDMSKSYDRIEWNFLEAMLKKVGFSDWWVHLVMQWVTTVSYSIVHGEHGMGPIFPKRGIRQGDPLSPYLLIICAEGLSALINRSESKKWLHGIRVCRKAPIISHMLFADVSYLYCKADEVEAAKIIELLDIYEQASGQQVNRGKSSVFFSTNVIEYNRQLVCQVLQMNEANGNSTYLGLPSTLGKNKSALLGYLKDKDTAKIKSWDGKYILRSGKEVLIKSVAQTLPTYAMHMFLLPFEITKYIEKTLSNFWWKTSQEKNSGLIWMNCDQMSKHKSSGGMGFRDFCDFNIAMLGKQAWRFISNPNSLVSKLYQARYFAKTDFLNSELGHNPSFIWRSICEAKDLIRNGVRWNIGRTVASLFQNGNSMWDLDIIKSVFNDREQQLILDTIVSDNNREDELYWLHEASGLYSVKSAYRWLQQKKEAWRSAIRAINRTVAAAKQYLTQWSIAQNRSTNTLLQPIFEGDGDCIWVNPQQNSVKVSVDTTVFEDIDAAGLGLVARDDKGVLLQAKTILWPSPVAPVLAEAMAVKEALSWIDGMQWPNVTLVSDCLVVIQVIRSKTPMRSQFGSIIEDCRSYLRRLNKISLYHVKRSANMVAHTLARESYNYPGRSFDRNSIPRSVKHFGYVQNRTLKPLLEGKLDPQAAAVNEKLMSKYLAKIEFLCLKVDSKFLLGNFQPSIADLSLLVPDSNRILSPYKKVLQWIEDTRHATNPYFDESHSFILELKAVLTVDSSVAVNQETKHRSQAVISKL
ncbi:hypothetical protein AgCh_023591 [Apium graveolens]